jgi:hypothetical protein
MPFNCLAMNAKTIAHNNSIKIKLRQKPCPVFLAFLPTKYEMKIEAIAIKYIIG